MMQAAEVWTNDLLVATSRVLPLDWQNVLVTYLQILLYKEQ